MSDLAALIAKLQMTVNDTPLGLYPTSMDIVRSKVSCDLAVRAVAEFVRSQMAEVERHTGIGMQADDAADWIVSGFRDNCAPSFNTAEEALRYREPAYRRSAPGGHGLAA